MKNIDLKLVEKLADKMNENSLNEISIEKGDEKITLKREIKSQPVVHTQSAVIKKAAPVAKTAAVKKEKEIIKGNVIVAPTVGTFYSSPAPGEAPFVMVGDRIETGKIVCIIEAMKMMNEVTSNFNGKIVKIFVEDGTVVQKGDQLFVVE